MVEVVAALVWEGNKFMICQRPAHKARGLLWEFVGGKVEAGESREAALHPAMDYVLKLGVKRGAAAVIKYLMRMCRNFCVEKFRKEREEQERVQAEAEKKQRRRSRLFWQLFSGNILVTSSVKANYSYLIAIAVMCFVSIFVMFTALYADLRYSRVEREVQLVRERSIRLQEQLYGKTTHAAIREELQRRGINLQDPQKTKEGVEY